MTRLSFARGTDGSRLPEGHYPYGPHRMIESRSNGRSVSWYLLATLHKLPAFWSETQLTGATKVYTLLA